jgi:hypothetical protein
MYQRTDSLSADLVASMVRTRRNRQKERFVIMQYRHKLSVFDLDLELPLLIVSPVVEIRWSAEPAQVTSKPKAEIREPLQTQQTRSHIYR